MGELRNYVELVRVPHWVKNAFVVLPVFFDPTHVSGAALVRVGLGVVAFCLASSAVYVLNDLVDRERDRHHPEKRLRPLAAGRVSEAGALALAGALATAAVALASALSASFLAVLGAYVALNAAYSFRLKDVSIVDLLCIASGFVLRVEGGGALIDVWPSPWMVICTGLLALFLATAKRRDDVLRQLGEDHRASLQGYNRRFLDAALVVLLGAAVVSYSVYTTDVAVRERLQTDRLYLTIPFVVAGCLRYLQIILVEEQSGAPTDVVYRDPFMIRAIAGWLITCGLLLYG